MTTNRKRTSSTAVKQAVAQVAMEKIKTPPGLSKNAKKHFRQIIARRAKCGLEPSRPFNCRNPGKHDGHLPGAASHHG